MRAKSSRSDSVEALDEQDGLAQSPRDLHRRYIETGSASQLHRDVLALNHGDRVAAGRELDDQAATTV